MNFSILKRIFITNWPRKLVAVISALIIWMLVSESLTTSRTIANVPIRIINLPPDKTVEGILPNGLLKKKITLTLEGKKSAIEEIQPTDLEVVLNAQGKNESWLATIDQKSVVSLNPSVDFKKEVTKISGNDIFIKLSKLITLQIPVTITKPIGDSPQGYQFVDVWPKYLSQTVTGPEAEVAELKSRGLTLTFDLSKIKKKQLDELQEIQNAKVSDEVSYFVPGSWKQIPIPFREGQTEPLNDPRAEFLRIDFLKQDLLLIGNKLPLALFFPPKYVPIVNPQTYSLVINALLEREHGVTFLDIPLYAKNVSQLFLDVVKDNLLIFIIMAPKEISSTLGWSLEFIDQNSLEEAYLKRTLDQNGKRTGDDLQPQLREEYLRNRFRTYLHKLVLYRSANKKLKLVPTIKEKTVEVTLK